jgi:multidrug efflux pump
MPQLPRIDPQRRSLDVVMERTTTIRASLRDVERTLIDRGAPRGARGLRLPAATGAPRSCPASRFLVSLIATFGAMYLFGFSLTTCR